MGMNGELTALKFILRAGQIRESDLLNLLRKPYATSHSSRDWLHKMVCQGLIEPRDYQIKSTNSNRKTTERVYSITQEGKNYLVKNLKDESLASVRIKPTPPDSILPATLDRHLTDTGIASMFYACDIPVFPKDKPSLKYLRSTLLECDAEANPRYKDNLSKNELQALLEKGLYYALNEYVAFVGKKTKDNIDVSTGTRIRGLYISNRSCYPVYCSKKYDNKILRINTKGEEGFLSSLECFSQCTEIYRNIEALGEKQINSKGQVVITAQYRSKPNAIIISDGEMLAYATSTGNRKGKAPTKTIPKGKTTEDKHNNALLTATNPLYDKIYVIPSNMNGLYSLEYLLNYDIESYLADGIQYMKQDKRFIYDENSLNAFPYKDTSGGGKRSVTYMPVFEAKELYQISQSSENPTIITHQDLLNMIAHSIKKDGHYYDADNICPFDKDAAFIYSKTGDILGQQILDEYLKEQGKTYNKNIEGNTLPKRFGEEKIAFYNAIARGEKDLHEIEPLVKTKEYIEHPRYYCKTKIVSHSINSDLYDQLKKRAKAEGKSVSKLLNQLIKEYLFLQKH